MQSEVLFQQAMQYFSQQNTFAAIHSLQQAASQGHPMASLYLAEHYFRETPQAAFTFLQGQWKKGVTGTLHRLVTLKAFFTDETVTSEDFGLLHQEAINGHIESQLILAHLAEGHEYSHFYFCLLEQTSPALFADLQLAKPFNKIDELKNGELQTLLSFISDKFATLGMCNSSVSSKRCNIRLFRQVMSPLACRYIYIRLQGKLGPSLVHDPATGQGIQNSVRTSYIVHITPEHLDWFVLEFDMIIEILSGVSRAHGESMNLLRYQNGQEYKPHYDAIVGDGLQFDEIIRDGGQRIKTAITYLSDGYIGGETAFPKIDLTIKGGIGDVLLFDNLDENGNVLRDSYHAGIPVTEGTKWILTKWIRESATNYGHVVYPKKVNSL